jgi:hypothetical protein
MMISLGRIVHYVLTEHDANVINLLRGNGQTKPSVPAMAHVGNTVYAEEHIPAMVVAAWTAERVNLQCFLDGNDSYWATSIPKGEGAGTWHWPEREE